MGFSGSQRFELGERLGRGAYGIVYRAHDKDRETTVALKTLQHAAPDALLRFKTEFRALQDLQHPNLVHFEELFRRTGEWFFTMELVEGQTFLDYACPALAKGADEEAATLRTDGHFDEARLRSCLVQLAEGLTALHDAGLVHRDVKPANIRVTPEGRLVLLDFGLVSDVRPSAMRDVSVVGTPAYMSPEQARDGEAGPAADWYAVGVLLFRALTGNLPLEGNAIQLLVAKQTVEPVPPSLIATDVPEDLDKLCLELLHRDPAERPSGREVLARLRPETQDTLPPEASSIPTLPPFVGREAELHALRQSFVQSRAGALSLVFVEGESGVGKSALLEHFTGVLGDSIDDLVVLRGRCYQYESLPYKAFDGVIDQLSRYLASLDKADIENVLPDGAAALTRMFPVLGRVREFEHADLSTELPPDKTAIRDQSFEAVGDLLRALSDLYPIVIIIDDIQWSDNESLQLLERLGSLENAPALLMVITGRGEREYGAAVSESIARLVARDRKNHRRLDLAGLGQRESAALARALLPHDLDGDSAAAIAEEAGGHPLFIAELARHAQSAALRGVSSAANNLTEALQGRVRQLDPAQRRLLELSCVAGRPLHRSLAARAAQLGADELGRKLKSLRVARLVRTHREANATDGMLEPFHDRVRDAVVALLDEAQARAHHLCLAETLSDSAEQDVDALMYHYREAGEVRTAAGFAERAAARAVEALAFSRAADLYREALRLDPARDAEDKRQLTVHLADALSHAGRTSEAAGLYMRAVTGAAPSEAMDLRTRAARRYLQSGQLDPGIRAAREVLGAMGMRLPNRAGALASILYERARLKIRGTDFRTRDEAEVPPELLRRIDTVSTIGTALSVGDYIIGADFHARALRWALESGEPFRIARGLANEGATRAGTEDWPMRDSRALLDQARTLAERLGDPYTIGYTYLSRATSLMTHMQFRGSVEAGRECDRILAEKCSDVAWERSTAQWAVTMSLWNMGRYDELAECAERFLHEARDRGDLFARAILTTSGLCPLRVAQNRAGEGMDAVNDVMREWNQDSFQVQHYGEMQSLTDAEVYAGGTLALERQERSWPAFRRSLMPTMRSPRFIMLSYRAKAALCAARDLRWRRRALMRSAARDLKAARGVMSTPCNQGYVDLIEASLWQAKGDDERAIRLLARADGILRESEMHSFAAAARYRRGDLLGGDEGAAVRDEAAAWMRGRGIVEPRRYAFMRSPGLWE